MTREEVTLIAALLAATTSLISLLINLHGQRKGELRASHRNSLEPHVARLGEAIHQVVVSSNIYLFKTKTDESKNNWLERAQFSRDEIKALRRELRYPLWGLGEGLKQISRVCDFATHLKGDEVNSRRLIDMANDLKRALDSAIRKSYARGTPPSLLEIRRVNKAAKKLSGALKREGFENSQQ